MSMPRPSRRAIYPFDLEVVGPAIDGACPTKVNNSNSWNWTVVPLDTTATVAHNLIYAGPASGLPAAPGFRAMVLSDLPPLTVTMPSINNSSTDTINSTVATTAFATTYSIAGSTITANSMVRIRARGVYGSAGIATNLRIRVLLGGVVMLAMTATLTPASLTNAGWELEADLICNTAGSGGTFEAQGKIVLGNVSAGATLGPKGADIYMLTNIATIARSTVVANTVSIDVTWGASNAADTITLRQMTVELITA
jgi:hypothetical protein